MYSVFRFIVKMNLQDPGREDGEEVTDLAAKRSCRQAADPAARSRKIAARTDDAQTAAHIVEGLGGAEKYPETLITA